MATALLDQRRTRPSLPAQRSPRPPRDRFIDLLRAAAIVKIVCLHWLMPVISYDEDVLSTANALATGGGWAITWIAQVMSLVFFSGGAAAVMSFDARRRRHGPAVASGWVADRLHRLAVPAIPLAVAWIPLPHLLIAAGVPAQPVEAASELVGRLLWFLAAYVLLIVVTPALLRVHDRIGGGGIAVVGVGAVAVDAVRFGWLDGATWAGYPNVLLVWGTAYLAGDLIGIESETIGVLLYVAVGLVFLATLPYVARGLAAMNAAFGRAMLTNPGAAENAALRARAEQLHISRAAAVEAEATTLRRVERDIHDGPQQRLVRLTMDLEAVQRRLADDPQAARPLVDEALTQTQEALAELRALSRGIAPPILADRGLEAALAAAAGRCPVPVDLDVALGGYGRPPAAAENAAYFVVAEALTNVAKHSGSASATVSVVQLDGALHVQVSDDGVGGAHLGKGHGLAGLADRLAGIDGMLEVHSPVGGSTVVTAQIPTG